MSRELRPGLIFDVARRGNLELRGSGDNRQLRCIFPDNHTHGDKSASAHIYGPKNVYACSGCATTLTAKKLAEALGVDWRDVMSGENYDRVIMQPTPKPSTPEKPKRILADEIERAWSGLCASVYDDVQLNQQLKARGIDPATVADRQLARALVGDISGLSWPRFEKKSWLELGHRLILPTFDATGAMVSLHARRIVDGETPKGLSPAGAAIKGTVFADPGARLMLAGLPVDTRRVIIAEGAPDFLTWATHYGDAEGVPVIFGVISGSWTPEIAARIPTGCEVVIRTHHDAAGDKYARVIGETLEDRCRLFRPVSRAKSAPKESA